MMDMTLPGIIVTGASGFVGRHFLEAATGHFRLFCIARRSQFEAGIPQNENQRWTQVDIGHRDELLEVARCVHDHGGADYVLHLAGYYDFTYQDSPEYQRTNVEGTRNVLALADVVGARHFIYASSLAACKFPADGVVISEDTPPDADFPYARSKREAEAVVRQHSAEYRKSIVRFAALFSDWCEYPPVYAFLKTWASTKWNARVLGGKGKSSVPYLHVRDLTALLMRVIEKTDDLSACGIYNASPSTTTTHLEMFRAATRFLFGQERSPLHVPRIVAWPGVYVRELVLGLFGHTPFERSWMVCYIDRELRVDSSRTQKILHWQPTPRYDLSRRLLILIENMKSHPEVWQQRNEAAFVHAASRPNLVLYSRLLHLRESLVAQLTADLRQVQLREGLTDYERIMEDTLFSYVSLFYEILITSIRTRDRSMLRNYARILAYHRHHLGFNCHQVCVALHSFSHGIHAALEKEELPDVSPDCIHDCVDLSLQLACDEVEDVYEQLRENGNSISEPAESISVLSNNVEMQRLVRDLHDICRDGWELKGLFGKIPESS